MVSLTSLCFVFQSNWSLHMSSHNGFDAATSHRASCICPQALTCTAEGLGTCLSLCLLLGHLCCLMYSCEGSVPGVSVMGTLWWWHNTSLHDESNAWPSGTFGLDLLEQVFDVCDAVGILSLHSCLSKLHWLSLDVFCCSSVYLDVLLRTRPTSEGGGFLYHQVFSLSSMYLCLAVQGGRGRSPRSSGQSEEGVSAVSANCSGASTLCSDLYPEHAADPWG